METVEVRSKLFNKINKEEIHFSTLYPIMNDKEKEKIFRGRLNILFFNNSDKVDLILKFLEEKYKSISFEDLFKRELSKSVNEIFDMMQDLANNILQENGTKISAKN